MRPLTPPRTLRGPLGLMAVAVLLAVPLAAGCSAPRDNATSAPAYPAPAREGAADGGGSGQAKSAPEAPAQPGTTKQTPVKLPQSITYRGTLTVRVSDLDGSARRAISAVGAVGGTTGSDTRSGDPGKRRATIVFRVPPAKFTATVEKLAKLGVEIGRTVSSEDVTAVVSDLDSRITSAQTSVARTRQLFQRAADMSDIIALEAQLSERESQLESLRATKRGLADQVAASTITVNLRTTDKPAPPPERGFLAGLGAGWTALGSTVQFLLTAFGAALPFLIALAIPAAVAWIYVRRLRSRRTTTTPAPSPAPAAESGE